MFAKKIDSGIDMTVVAAWRQRYLARHAADNNFYHSGDSAITVGLPPELLQYSNAAGGHSGYSSGARPTGIRYTVDNPSKSLAEIFASDDNLARFISGSDCTGPAYSQAKRDAYFKKHGVYPGTKRTVTVTLSAPVRPGARLLNQTGSWDSVYGSGTLKALLIKNDEDKLKRFYHCLTIEDAATLLGLPQPEQAVA